MRAPDPVPYLDAEVEFVLALGGYALRVPGALLVTHEKIPAPRFNFVEGGRIAPQRQTAFFERTLDHYFQRALRPLFRLPVPVEPHVDRGLRRLGFTPRQEPLVLMVEGTSIANRAQGTATVRVAVDADLDALAEFWASPKERPEFRTALDIAWHHPHPEERTVPLVAEDAEGVAGAALAYRHGVAAGIHLVGTRPSRRGHGTASALVRFALDARPLGGPVTYSMFADSARLVHRLETLGFEPCVSFCEYDLPITAQLAFPEPGPLQSPRWRPPRGI